MTKDFAPRFLFAFAILLAVAWYITAWAELTHHNYGWALYFIGLSAILWFTFWSNWMTRATR
jgi:hypothetical protein